MGCTGCKKTATKKQLSAPSWAADCCLVTTTYDNLVAAITGGTLTQNTIYRFPYTTRHLIADSSTEYNYNTSHHDPGTGVKTTFTPETEYLWVRALTSSKVHVEVYSESYPNDIIHYDYTLNKTEDGIENRPGFITYRKDTKNDVSAHFDFRNVLHRRRDMNMSLGTRDAQYETALGYNGSSIVNHEIFYGSGGANTEGSIPAFTNFNEAGNAILGFVTTANNGVYRDFKTFVGYGETLYKTPSVEAPRYRNVHIQKSDSISRLLGSASGAAITLSNSGSGASTFPFFANVVIFARSVENVSIGENATGITITGRAVREINIGHNNENVIIGGMMSAPLYSVTTEPTQLSYNENISIGNSNRNIMIADANRRLTIGSSNIGILFNRVCFDITIGNYNTNVYNSLSNSNVIGDWCSTVRITSSNNVNVGSQSVTIDVVNSEPAIALLNAIYSVSKAIPDGFSNTLTESETSNSTLAIGDACNNVFISHTAGAVIGSQNSRCFIHDCSGLVMGMNNFKCDLWSSQALTIGSSNQFLEVSKSASSSIGNYCTSVKILDSTFTEIKDFVFQSMVSNVCNSCVIDNTASNVVMTYSNRIKVGKSAANITFRASDDFEVGSGSSSVYVEGSNGYVGRGCSNVIVNTIGLTMKPSFHADFDDYNYSISDVRIASASGRTYVGAGSPTQSSEYAVSLSEYINSPAFVAGILGCGNVFVGDACNNIVITASSNSFVGKGSSDIYIGESYAPTLNYNLVFTAGVANPAGSTPAYTVPNITGIAITTGYRCDNNVIGEKASNIKIRGVDKSNNEFGALVTGVQAVAAHAFTNNRVLVDGLAVTLTAAYDKKVYDKRSADNERWEMTISNAGALPANGTKLV